MKFGTSGLRGLSSDLKGEASYRYAAAFGHYLLQSGKAKRGGSILLGRDLRDSSPEIMANCATALVELGFDVLDCGTVPTPTLALYGLETDCPSLMITGSHIPADRNGIKFYRADGEIDKEDEVAISNIAASLNIAKARENTPLLPNRTSECTALFMARNRTLLPADALLGLKVGVYQHSTVARDMLVEILTHFGAEVLPFGRSETFIPVDTEAVSAETLNKLKLWTAEHELDAIVSADGDGDRPLVADEAGNVIRGDLLGLIAAQFLDAAWIVTPVTSNSAIEVAGEFQVLRTRVGSPYVIAGMNEAVSGGEARVVGFEANGGLLTANDLTINGQILKALPTRDCFLPILAILRQAHLKRQPLSRIAASYELPVAAADRLENIPVDSGAAFMAHLRAGPEELSEFLAPIGEVAATSDIDGLRVKLKDGRIIHFRPSGNAPEMRCYVEAPDADSADALSQAGLKRVREWLEACPVT